MKKIRNVKTFLLLLLCILLFSPSAMPQSSLADLPITLIDNHIFIELQLNDSKPLRFMFDTGAGVTVLNTSTAESLPLAYSGESKIGTGGKSLIAKTSEGNGLTIGELKVDSITIEVLPFDHLSDYFGQTIDGIIGYDLMTRYIIETDLHTMRFRLYPSQDFTPPLGFKPKKAYKKAQTGIGMDIEIKTLEGTFVVLPLGVDTGNSGSLTLFAQAFEKYPLATQGKRKDKSGFSIDSTVTKNVEVRLSELVYLGRTVKKLKTIQYTDPLSKKAFVDSDWYGLIGQKLLNKFDLIYDLPHLRIYYRER